MKKNKIKFTAIAALIAALYAGLTFLSSVAGLAFGPIQLRLSEALCVLPIFTPAAIPGLTVGCVIANMFSFSAVDIVFGSAATLASAALSYLFKEIRLKGLPLLALMPPIFINAAVVGLEITLFLGGSSAANAGFWLNFITVAIGQAIVCFGLGIPLFVLLRHSGMFENGTIK